MEDVMNWNDRGEMSLWQSVTYRKHSFVSGRSVSGLAQVTDKEMENFIAHCYLENRFYEYWASWI